jgi:hypothetical protein
MSYYSFIKTASFPLGLILMHQSYAGRKAKILRDLRKTQLRAHH